MSEKSYKLVETDYKVIPIDEMARQITAKSESFKNMKGAFRHMEMMPDLDMMISTEEKKILEKEYNQESLEIELEQDANLVSRLEALKIMILYGDSDYADYYAQNRAIKLKSNMMTNLTNVSRNIYSIGSYNRDAVFNSDNGISLPIADSHKSSFGRDDIISTIADYANIQNDSANLVSTDSEDTDNSDIVVDARMRVPKGDSFAARIDAFDEDGQRKQYIPMTDEEIKKSQKKIGIFAVNGGATHNVTGIHRRYIDAIPSFETTFRPVTSGNNSDNLRLNNSIVVPPRESENKSVVMRDSTGVSNDVPEAVTTPQEFEFVESYSGYEDSSTTSDNGDIARLIQKYTETQRKALHLKQMIDNSQLRKREAEHEVEESMKKAENAKRAASEQLVKLEQTIDRLNDFCIQLESDYQDNLAAIEKANAASQAYLDDRDSQLRTIKLNEVTINNAIESMKSIMDDKKTI